MTDSRYRLKLPKSVSSCAVFNAAHSGTNLPADFVANSRLSVAELRSSEDAFVDRLISKAPLFGAPLLAANFSRSFVDANRSFAELDPALIDGLPRQKPNPRVAVGLGVLPRIVSDGKIIQDGKIDVEAAENRLNTFYFPYHAALKKLIAEQKQRFGMCLLFDFHSMPKEAIKSAPHVQAKMADIILGDRFGSACDRWVMDAVEMIFRDSGFSVARNAPFAGGYITQHYGRPKKQVHAVQIEINRSLYMDEKSIMPLESFSEFHITMSNVVENLTGLGPAALKFAAE